MSNTSVYANYSQAIANLPADAFLGSLLFFSISNADVNLEQARHDLTAAGLSTATLRKNLRPVDAFRKASKEFAKKFREVADVRSELMVRPVGEDSEQAHRHLMLERAVWKAGKKRRVFYEKVGELVFTRGTKKNGEYTGHSVEAVRTTNHLSEALTEEEEAWLSTRLESFEDRYHHLLTYMDSHAVRTFVREYIYSRGGICVKESGGLYFVRQQHAEEIERLARWVKSVGSEFHALPLLNLADQRDMILQAFEEETVTEVDRLMDEVKKILAEPGRQIEARTYDAYAEKAIELREKMNEYSAMLGSRADQARIQIDIYGRQMMSLASRIRETKTKVT